MQYDAYARAHLFGNTLHCVCETLEITAVCTCKSTALGPCPSGPWLLVASRPWPPAALSGPQRRSVARGVAALSGPWLGGAPAAQWPARIRNSSEAWTTSWDVAHASVGFLFHWCPFGAMSRRNVREITLPRIPACLLNGLCFHIVTSRRFAAPNEKRVRPPTFNLAAAGIECGFDQVVHSMPVNVPAQAS